MNLRKLELKDAVFMLEWMHDISVVENLQGNFLEKTISDCREFIQKSWTDECNLHMAVADGWDTYMGTVSLKNIDRKNACAEFAIVMRSAAMGKGFSKSAMEEILRIGFDEMGLKRIYWYVSEENKRAVRFYDKNGYHQADKGGLEFLRGGGIGKDINSYLWYLETADRDAKKSVIKKD